MQCHLEMTPELMRKCAAKGASEIERKISANRSAALQPVEQMLRYFMMRCSNRLNPPALKVEVKLPGPVFVLGDAAETHVEPVMIVSP